MDLALQRYRPAAAAAETAAAEAAAAASAPGTDALDRMPLESEVLCRTNVFMDISAPVPRPRKDPCSHVTSSQKDVQIDVTDDHTVHNQLLHINLQMLATPLNFKPTALREGLLMRLLKRDLGGVLERNTATLYCRQLEDYVPSGTSAQTYFTDVLGGQLCTARPELSYIFGEDRNPVTPLLPRPDPLPVHATRVWLEDVKCETAAMSMYAGPVVRNYFYLVCLQCWLSVNNQFVRQRVYSPDKPYYLTALSQTDCYEAADQLVEDAENQPPRKPPAGLTASQMAFYNSLNRLEQDIFWKSYPLAGAALANLAQTLSLHEFVLAIQCKLFVHIISAKERKNFVRNLTTILISIRFRLCEFPNYQELANATIQEKLRKDAEDPESAKQKRGDRRTDPVLRSNEKLSPNEKTTVEYEYIYRNAATRVTYSLLPRDEQRRVEPLPLFLSHARFGPHAPVVALGTDKKQQMKNAAYQLAAIVNWDDRGKFRKKLIESGYGDGYFTAADEPECVKIRGHSLLYSVIQPNGNVENLFAVHPTAFYAAQSVSTRGGGGGGEVETPTSGIKTPKRKRPTAATAVDTSTQGTPPAKRAAAGKRARVVSINLPDAKDFDGISGLEMYHSFLSPHVMTAETIQRFMAASPTALRLNYASQGIISTLDEIRRGNPLVAPWAPTETLTFLEKFFRARQVVSRGGNNSESAIWEVILHCTAAMHLDPASFRWENRAKWVPMALDYLRSTHGESDREVYRARHRDALAAARFDPRTDTEVLAALTAAFRYDSGLDTYSSQAMRPINRMFNSHFFTAERVRSLMEARGMKLQLNGMDLSDSTLSRLLIILCNAVATNTTVASGVFDIHMTARCHGTEWNGRAIAGAILAMWESSVKRPLFFHAQYISNPPVGPRFATGSEWGGDVRSVVCEEGSPVTSSSAAAVASSSSSSSSAIAAGGGVGAVDSRPKSKYKSTIEKARSTLLGGFLNRVKKAQYPKEFAGYDYKSEGDNMCNIAVSFAMAEAVRRYKEHLQKKGRSGRNGDTLTQLENIWDQMRSHATTQLNTIARVFDLAPVVASSATAASDAALSFATGSAPPAAAAAAAAGAGAGAQSWRHYLSRVIKRGRLVRPSDLSDVYRLAMGQVPSDSVESLEKIIGMQIADECRMKPDAMIIPFVRQHLAFEPHGVGAGFCFYNSASAISDELARSIDIMQACFSELRIPFTVCPLPAPVQQAHPSDPPHHLHQPAAAAAAAAIQPNRPAAAAALAIGDGLDPLNDPFFDPDDSPPSN
jgi:hypothetical protein